ncbi:molybdopterin biosynthesis protein MoeB [Pasteurella multocida subsp. multocida str. Anand1_cattle]|nr:molybdopterin biosynthesis protein MoeB [Pasteurella multocida subsp. multocida str. Anand1_cattle]
MILDCTDNVEIRNQLDQVCQQAKVPLVSGAAIRLEGQVTVFTYQENTPTYRTLSQLFWREYAKLRRGGCISAYCGHCWFYSSARGD